CVVFGEQIDRDLAGDEVAVLEITELDERRNGVQVTRHSVADRHIHFVLTQDPPAAVGNYPNPVVTVGNGAGIHIQVLDPVGGHSQERAALEDGVVHVDGE